MVDVPTVTDINDKLYELKEPLRILRGWEIVEQNWGDVLQEQWRDRGPYTDFPERSELLQRDVPNGGYLEGFDPDLEQAVYQQSIIDVTAGLDEVSTKIEDTLSGSLYNLEQMCTDYADAYRTFQVMLGDTGGPGGDMYGSQYQNHMSTIWSIESVTSEDNWKGADGDLAREQFGEVIQDAVERHRALTEVLSAAAGAELEIRSTAHKEIHTSLKQTLNMLNDEIEPRQNRDSLPLGEVSLILAGVSLAATSFPPVGVSTSILSFATSMIDYFLGDEVANRPAPVDAGETAAGVIDMLKNDQDQWRASMGQTRRNTATRLDEQFADRDNLNDPRTVPGNGV